MSEMKKRSFQVLESSEEEIQESRKRRRRGILRVILPLLLLAILGAGAWLTFTKYKTYSDYEVKSEQATEGVSESEFYDFDGKLLKVSKNGAILTNIDGSLIWNQSYEINSPMVDICEEYVAIGSRKGREVYVLDTKGLAGRIETAGELRAVEVAKQGTIAVLTQRKDSYYVNMYEPGGTKLVQGEMHIENSGYPIAMSLSEDALKLGISLVNVNNGQADTTVNFYNFGAVGQNEIDNLVKSYTYENQLIPRIVFFDESHAVAVAERKIYFYKGNQKPEETRVVRIPKDIRSLIFSDQYMGLTYNEETEKQMTHNLMIYDCRGKQIMEKQYQQDYTTIRIMGDNEVLLLQGEHARIYTMDGTVKFKGDFEEPVLKMTQGQKGKEYYLIYENKMQKIQLK
ncbi:MAG: hypothetical protein E7280_12195 [Lachnospiraceae bacterium]|nr:hypothetical protein [Lachnospiraceae bacterium]